MFLYEPHELDEPETLNQVQPRPVQLQWDSGYLPAYPTPDVSSRSSSVVFSQQRDPGFSTNNVRELLHVCLQQLSTGPKTKLVHRV